MLSPVTVDGRRAAGLGQQLTADVFRALLASDITSATILRVALSTPLPTVPAPVNTFLDSAGRPVDAFDYAVSQALSVTGSKIAGVVELSGAPASDSARGVAHARALPTRHCASTNDATRFVVTGVLDVAAVYALECLPDATPLAVTAVDDPERVMNMLRDTKHLKALDLSRCASLTTLDTGFLNGCESLCELELPTTLTSIGMSFCMGAGLRVLDLSQCTGLTRLGDAFLNMCVSLRELALPPSVASIGDFFCVRTSIETLDLSQCTSLTQIGIAFLNMCVSLRELKLPATLTSIGAHFCSSATGLKALDLSHCTALTEVAVGFLARCKSLRALSFPTSVTSVGPSFCQGSSLDGVDAAQCMVASKQV